MRVKALGIWGAAVVVAELEVGVSIGEVHAWRTWVKMGRFDLGF